jgi:DNA invertase Pin-like site-specific DNA recombinase
MAHMTRAVIYLRQSLDNTGEALAVARQRKDCEALADQRGWTVTEVITDNDLSASGKVTRPGYQRVLSLVDDRAVDVVVVWHVDRLVRRLVDLEDVIERCERASVRLATVSGDIDLSTDAGRLVGRILASVARGEMERKGARQRRANLQRAEQGHAPTWSNRAFGYERDMTTVRATEKKAVVAAYDQLLSGGSLNSIARQWQAAGHETPAGGKVWRATSVRAILLNPRVAALRAYNREIVGRGDWEPLVSEDAWRAVTALLGDEGRKQAKGVRTLLGGLLVCGGCGATPMRGAQNARGTATYRCARSTEAAGHVSRRRDHLDAYITMLVVERLSRPDAADLLVDHDRPDVNELRAEAHALRARLDSSADEFSDGIVTAAQLRRITERVKAKLGAVEAKMAEAGRLSALGPLVGAKDVREAWNETDLPRQRAVIATLMEITAHSPGYGRKAFDPESVRIDWRQP